jgi:polysaccharide biosynthesis transport protein
MWTPSLQKEKVGRAANMEYQVLSRSAADREALVEDRWDLLRFVEFIRERWLVLPLACGLAVTLAGLGSLFLPKKYTATASLLISPPAGNDPRAATAVSPVYLESLKTYERFAGSDSLFANALDRLHLRDRNSSTPIEKLKRRVLKVTKPRDTKILEISATLSSAKDAQALAKFIAEETVRLNASLDRQSQMDFSSQVRQQLEDASARLQRAEKAQSELLTSDPVDTLEAEIKNATEQKLRLQSELAEARIDLADYEARLQSRPNPDPEPREAASMREQLAASRARTARIEKEDRDLAQVLSVKGTLLEKRKHQRDILDAQSKSARAQYELALSRNNDTMLQAAFRGERLEIIDAGTVPEQPSSPNIPVNMVIAFFAAVIGCSAYFALKFSFLRLRYLSEAKHFPVAD